MKNKSGEIVSQISESGRKETWVAVKEILPDGTEKVTMKLKTVESIKPEKSKL